MPRTVAVYKLRNHHRSQVVCDAMISGIAKSGDIVRECYEDNYERPDADVAVFYGLSGNTPKLFKDYAKDRKAVYVDLGYWGRRDGGRWTGYHKLSVNDRHPTLYFRNRQQPGDRVLKFGLDIKPWRTAGRHILLAGMGEKAAYAEGYEVEQWERWAIKVIQSVTKRTVIYRPKPSYKRARPIAGVGYSPPKQPLGAVLHQCHAIVTHHSNVGVDALVAGIPVFSMKGVACTMGLQDLTMIEKPIFPEGREQWVSDLAYCQWSIREMKAGLAWQHLVREGLV